MTERASVFVVAAAIVLVAVLAMLSAHEHHYKERRYRHLESRLRSLEEMYLEDRRS